MLEVSGIILTSCLHVKYNLESVSKYTNCIHTQQLIVRAGTYCSLASRRKVEQSNRCTWRSIAALVSLYQTW